MCNWRRWVLPGLLATAILTALAMIFHSGSIERDLAGKAGDALQAEHPWASVALDGRDLTLSGTAPSPEAQAAAETVALNAYDVRVVDNTTDLLALADPYEFKAVKDDNGVTLSGFVPNDAVRAEIVGAAETAMPGIAVTDTMALARGAPEGLAAMAGFGLSQLGNLVSGEASLSNTDYTISGVAADSDAYEAELARANGTLPAGATLASADIAAPTIDPFTWSATKAADGTITLDGFVPSVDARAAIEADAAAQNPGATIVNNTRIANGAPAGFAALTAFGLGQLPDFVSGSVNTSNLDYAVNGVAVDSPAYDRAVAAANGSLPEGASLANAAITPPAAEGAYVWAANKAQDGRIVLTGFAPSLEARDAIAARAAELNPGNDIVNEMQVAEGAPDGFDTVTDYALGFLPTVAIGNANLSDLDLNVQGRALDVDSYEGAIARAADVPAGIALDTNIMPAMVAPYVWSAQKAENGAITLEGFMPSAEARDAVAARAAELNPGAEIDNRIRIASGNPDGFAAAADFGLGYLPRVQTGSVSLSDLDMSVAGLALDSDAFDGAHAADETAPDNVAVTNTITAPAVTPYVWSATKAGDATITLEGFAPSFAARAELEQQAAASNPGSQIVNNLKIATGEAEGFQPLAAFGLGQLADFDTGMASISDNNYTVSGIASDQAAFDRATAAVASTLPGSGVLASASITPPANDGSYSVSATRTDDVIVLEGVVPSEKDRAEIVAATNALGNVNVVDRMTLASGSPDGIDWGNAVGSVFGSLEGIGNGTVTVRDTVASIDADARDTAGYDAANAAWSGDLAQGLEKGSVDIRLPRVSPYVWRADKSEGGVTLTGNAPSDDVADKLAADAGSIFGSDAQISSSLNRALGEPVGFEAAANVGMTLLERLENGYAEIVDNTLTVSGVARSPSIKTAVEQAVVASVPPGFTGVPQITVPPAAAQGELLTLGGALNLPEPEPAPEPEPEPEPAVAVIEPAACQLELDETLKSGQIRFATNEAVIEEESFALLDRLAEIVASCPDATVRIEGHTDADGSEAYNQRLSERRAVAVFNYLVVAGISSSRMDAEGFGETRPIAPNNTAEGKAQNRRIQFTVVE